jgi:uroporphyrinogen III methyltransferase/synthase
LAEQLTAAGARVDAIVVYASTDRAVAEASILQQLETGQVDWVTVTSSAIAGALHVLFGQQLRNARLASISPVTSHTLRQLGYDVAAEARQYTMAGLVDAILVATDSKPS